jgi:hypothetical protein
MGETRGFSVKRFEEKTLWHKFQNKMAHYNYLPKLCKNMRTLGILSPLWLEHQQ